MMTALLSVPAHAQRTQLQVTGFPVAFAAPTAAELTSGTITSATATTFTINAQTGTTAQRTATVSIRCQAPCPTAGTSKTVADLQWRRADLAAWNTLSTTDVVIETRAMFRGQPLPASNDPWSNSLYWRFVIDWNDVPATYTYNIVMTLTVTVP